VHRSVAASETAIKNDGIQARIAEIMAVGAERAEVTAEEVIRELKKLGFSCIGKAVTWRNEVVTQELEGGEEGETRTVMVPRVTIVPTEDLDKATLDAIAEVSQQANGAVRVKMHDKHAALVSLGRHLGLFRDHVKVAAVYGISEEPMSAEEWKRQYVKPGYEIPSHAVLAAAGYNFRRLLAWLRFLLLRILIALGLAAQLKLA